MSAKTERDYGEYEDAFSGDARERRARKPKPKRESSNLAHGVVVRARGHHFDVETTAASEADGVARQRMCEVRGRLLQERGRDTLVAVGDRVWVRPEGANKGLIERIDERGRLSRTRPCNESEAAMPLKAFGNLFVRCGDDV